MVIALAGRRVDAEKSETVRFPVANVPQVRKRISDWFAQHTVHTLVCSAACGADLLALDVAGEFNIRRRIVLPFTREQFRASSVVDRGGEWGAPFDAILDAVTARGDVLALGYTPENELAYLETNHAILELAVVMGEKLSQPVKILLVWDGVSRGDDDVTAAFQQEAYGRGLEVEEISTF
jgi:hypothetical protein